MAGRLRRIHSPAFTAKVTPAAIKGEKTPIALAQDFDVNPNRKNQKRPRLRPLFLPAGCRADDPSP